MSSKKIKLLLTAAGTQTFANVYTALQESEDFVFEIVGCDIDPLAYGLYLADKKYIVPKASKKDFIPKILEICKKEEVDIVLPLLSLEYPKFSKNKGKFEKIGVKLPISGHKTVDICMDKKKTYDFFTKNNVRTPKTFLLGDLPKDLTFPVIIKPRSSSGSKNIYIANNEDEMDNYLKRVENPVVQEYLDGQEFTIDILSSWDSKPIAIIPRSRLDTMDGKSVKGKTVKEKELTEVVEYIIKRLKLVGPSNIQCFKVKDEYIFTEVNSRFSAGGLPLAVASGVNTPLLLVKMSLGEKFKGLVDYEEGLYMLRYFSEVVVKEKDIIKDET